MQAPTWLRPPRGVHWTPKLATTLALIVITGVLALRGLLSVILALFTFGGDADPAATLENSLKTHDQLAKIDRDRFDGRSAFFMPVAPVRIIPKPPPPKVEKPLPPPAPVIPLEYLGKKPIAILGPMVYFDNFQIKVGEESNGIKVIATNAPWNVKLGYEGGEYEVAIWEQKKEDFFSGKWPTSKTQGIESTTSSVSGKDKNNPDGAGRGATSGIAKSGAGNRPSHPGGAVPPGTTVLSPLGSTPSNPHPAGTGPGGPLEAGLPESAPPPEPIQPALEPQSQPPQSSASASKNSGWNSNQMAPPPPFTPEQINDMPLSQAIATQATIQKAKSNPSLDGATAERLANELAQLAQRINALKGQSNPP
ncbi:MAG: hypothetical protein EXS12_02560 [Phycisphaerales bacterium]|nr:hypothetical protein [Phycisphaerales bacterium]